MKKTLLYSAVVASVFAAGIAVGAGAMKAITVTPADEVKWTPMDPTAGDKGPQWSLVFGDMKKKGPTGMLMKFPAGMMPGAHTHTSDYYGVVISGTQKDFAPGEEASAKDLKPGSTWFQPGKMAHDNHCSADAPCEIFAYFPNGFDFAPAKAAAAKEAPKTGKEAKETK
ncbi:MAG: cupin domain-containing protein [Myxococcaceae bacterium]